jgi:hypothetical protein
VEHPWSQVPNPPIDRGAEIRCYISDPDGHLIEVGQATGFLKGFEEEGWIPLRRGRRCRLQSDHRVPWR